MADIKRIKKFLNKRFEIPGAKYIFPGWVWLHKEIKIPWFKKAIKKPEFERAWTTMYYGHRGSGKTLHQAKEIKKTLEYLRALYEKHPDLPRAIVYSIQVFNKEITEKYSDFLYYWEHARDLRYCPRKNCWRGKRKHKLHGCYLVFDDIATILPADNWQHTPMWLRKTFTQARHSGIRIVANLQDPTSCDVNFRRCVDVAYKFKKIIGSPDPDETKPPVKRIWGWYKRRKINAELLWKLGDMTEFEIQEKKQKEIEKELYTGKRSMWRDIWRGSIHWIGRKSCEIYDTTQDVMEYKPEGYICRVIKCIDPDHNHEDPEADNYCNYKKKVYELV